MVAGGGELNTSDSECMMNLLVNSIHVAQF